MFLDGIAAPVDNAGVVHAEGAQQVGDAQALALAYGPTYGHLAQDDGRVGRAEMVGQGCLVRRGVEVDGVPRAGWAG